MTKTGKLAKYASFTLAILMIVSVLCMGFTANAAVPNYNIDTSKTASLTLYKYEMPDVSAAATGSVGEMSDQTKVPAGAKLLPGATFTIYQLDTDIKAYFGPNPTKTLPANGTAGKALVTSSTVKYSKTTGNDGKAVFSNLPLGVYVVEETASPAQVTRKVAPFVLTLPYTNSDGTKWLYDVYAFPKNQTNYGGITLKKVDSVSKQPLKDATFTLYRKNSTGWSTYKTGIKTGNDGTASIASLPSQTTYRFIETDAPDASYILDSTVAYEFDVDASGNVANCKKVNVGSTTGTPMTVTDNTIVVENEKPGIHKFILDGPKGNEGIDNTQDIGKVVNWKIRTTIPKTVGKLTTYNVVDTMSTGLKYKDAEIYIDDTTKLTKDTDYTVSASGLNVTFTFTPSKLAGGNEVIIYFDTYLTTDAVLATDIPNTSKLVYTNKVGTDSTYETPSETPTVHTGGLAIKKVSKENNQPLAGATFKLYRTEADAKNGVNSIAVKTTSTDGLAVFTGFKYGGFSTNSTQKASNGVTGGKTNYWIVETDAPNGYSLLAEPIKVEVNHDSHITTAPPIVVENTKVPTLPNTGSFAVNVLFILAGSMAAFGAALLVYRKIASKKR